MTDGPGLFLARPGAGHEHVLSESTIELSSFNVLGQKE